MIGATLQDEREELDWLIDLAADPALADLVIGDMVMTAARCDVIGEEYDLLRYTAALALAMNHSEQTGDEGRQSGYGEYMIAALSALADLGNETAAMSLNAALPTLPPAYIERGKVRFAERQEARNGR